MAWKTCEDALVELLLPSAAADSFVVTIDDISCFARDPENCS
jgi:hypothetical protein